MAELSSDLSLALRIRALVEGQDAIVGLGTSFVELNQRIENLIRGLTAISGSTDGAAQEFEYLAGVSEKYGLKILDLSDNYVKLIASSKGTALEGEAVKKVFDSVSGAMAVLGGDTVTVHRAFNALAQMMSKGQIYSEELKGQLAEAIPGALGIMSRALGITTADLLALMEAGSLSSDVLLPFATQLEQEFGKFATTGKTFTQAVNELKNAWTLLMKRFADGTGAFKALTDGIEFLSKSSGILAGAVGIGLVAAFRKFGLSMVASIASARNYVTMLGVQTTATERNALAEVEAATARELASRRTLAAAIAQENLARANRAAATSSASIVLTEHQLAVATTASTIAKKEATAATLQLELAQKRLIASQGLMARTLGFLAGPGGLILSVVAGFAAMAYVFREQDEATNNLAKSTDEYRESLEKMTAKSVADSIKKAEADKKAKLEEIQNIKEIIATNQKLLEINKGNIASSVDYLKAQVNLEEQTEKLEKAESELLDLEIKIGDSRSSLVVKSSDLLAENAKLSASSVDLKASIESQREEIEALKKIQEDGVPVAKNLQIAYEELKKTQGELSVVSAKLKVNQDSQNVAMSDYVKQQKALAPAIDSTTDIIDDQKISTEELEAKFRLLVQTQLSSINRQNALKNAVVEMKGEQEALTISLQAQVNMLERQANAIGDVTAARAASVAKAEAERESAKQSLGIANLELEALREERREKLLLLEANPKIAKQTNEQISKLDALIAKQNAEVEARRNNVIATRLEAEAAKVAGETISQSIERQSIASIEANAELAKLIQTYADMEAAGEDMDKLRLVMDAITEAEKRVSDQASATEIAANAAFRSLGLNFEEVMTGMDFETRKQIDALKTLALQGELTGTDLRKAMDQAINTVNTRSEIEKLIGALEEMQRAGVISAGEAGIALAALRQKLVELGSSVDPVDRALANLGVGVPDRLNAVAAAAKASFDVISQSQQPIENVRDSFLKWAEASIAAANASGTTVDPMLRQIATSLKLVKAYENLVAGMRRVNPELENMKDRFGELRQIESERVSTLGEIQSAQEAAARSEIEYYRSIGATSVARQKEQELSARQIEFSKSMIAAKYAELKTSLAEQGVKAALLEINKASNPVYKQERALIELTVESINKKIDALKEELKFTELSGNALAVNTSKMEESTDATERSSDATDRHADAARDDAEATEEQSKSYQLMEDSATGAVRELSAMSAGLNALLSQMLNVRDVGELFGASWSGELGKLRLALEQTDYAIQHNLRIIGPYAGQFEKNANAANSARKAYLEQAIEAVGLTENLTKLSDAVLSNTSELESFILRAELSKESMDLLDETNLDNLEKAIESAKDKLVSLQDEARAATDRLTELNAEIAAAKGDTETSDKLKLQLEQQQAIADVEKSLAAAREQQNADLIALYEQQLSKLDELYRIKEKNLEADIEASKRTEIEKNKSESGNADTSTGGSTSGGVSGRTSTTTINNTFLIDPTKLANEEWVKRNVMPTIEKVGRLRA